MTKAITTMPDEQALADLRQDFPVETGFQQVLLPRLSMASQDVMEGKGKNKKVVVEAGTFFTEVQTEEIDEETGKKKWQKTEIGTELEATILYRRKQLKFFDGSAFTSSPVYDTDDEIIPLFSNKAEIARGTPAELRARPEFQGVTAKGKPTSKLEENKVLYVLYEDEIYQMNLRGTSMFAYQKYARTVLPPSVLTRFSSEPKENGATEWNQMTFATVRSLDAKEVTAVAEKIKHIKESIGQVKAQFASQGQVDTKAIDAFEKA